MDWIAIDWGTSNLRAWSMTDAGETIDQLVSPAGMATLKPTQFESTLLELVSHWIGKRTVPIIACGMVGARQGWTEAPYTVAPCPAALTEFVKAPATDPRLDARIIPGICQKIPPDVMRGEETQIAGFLAGNPGFDGVLCLPGTHTKWVHVSACEIVSFRTFMTGELFGLLSTQSVLRHSVGGDGWDFAAFADALDITRSRPESLAARLFELRAEDLVLGLSGATARSRLSGMLIGAELAAARSYWLGQQVALIGASDITSIYAVALNAQGVDPIVAEGDTMTLAGLTVARRAHQERI